MAVEVGDEIIETTSEHLFWVVDSGWVEAKNLQPGHLLMDVDGNYIPVNDVCLEDTPTTVYNFEVADAHDYFVSEEHVLVHNAPCSGRFGKQARLRELMTDPKISKADRGWLKQELNSIKRGQRRTMRVPPGKQLAHKRGFEARKGYGYGHSNLQNTANHRLQHKVGGY